MNFSRSSSANEVVKWIQTDLLRRHRLAFVSPTCVRPRVAFDCSFIGDSCGSVKELICSSTTPVRALPGPLSRLPDAGGGSPSTSHSACPCVVRVAVEVIVLRDAKGLCSRNSTCALAKGASPEPPGRRRIFENLQKIPKENGKNAVFSPILQKDFKTMLSIFARLDEKHNCLGKFEKFLKIFDENSMEKLNFSLFSGKNCC